MKGTFAPLKNYDDTVRSASNQDPSALAANMDCRVAAYMLKMNMSKKPLIALAALLIICGPLSSYAFEAKGQDCSKCHTLNPTEAKDLLKNVFPDIRVLDIRVSPSNALWEIYSESGGQKGLVYLDFSKKYVMLGPLLSVRERRNLSQERLVDLNRIDVSQIPLEDALVMGDPGARIRIVVFDDPD
jgi:thiol:disulfide interchange protein DsbC